MGRWIIFIAGLFPGVWSGNWGVTFENQCALKGTSVNLKCNYDYPALNIITWVGWYKHHPISNVWHWVLLSDLHSPPNHFKYIGKSRGDCSLRINNVQYSDQGKYRFRFSSTLGSWTSKGHASLEVKDLTLVVQPSTVREGDTVRLTCRSGCPGPAVFFFFKDGRRIQSPQFQARREDAGKYYCVIQGPETVWSATVALSVHCEYE
ncbi:uncharacterized protein LOC119786569 [Cyprinodon tularosa]|uniref:uncharacterized protein LOC119786569 n=1 Tax=Cyprinodon tularosa TaxID=77115 RepID=UPI0018E1F76B|nr:uncharacterized protein LOC119786569 [Cyprinodon tularosa]